MFPVSGIVYEAADQFPVFRGHEPLSQLPSAVLPPWQVGVSANIPVFSLKKSITCCLAALTNGWNLVRYTQRLTPATNR